MADKERIKENSGIDTAILNDTKFFEDICENSHDLIQCIDKKGKFVYVNKKWMRILGYSGEEIAKLKLDDILHPDQRRKCNQLFKRVCRGETIEDIETVFLTNDGKEIVVHGNVNPRMKDGKFLTTVGIFSDITLRKMGEEALMKSEEKYRLISENTADLIAVLDTKGNHLYVSPSYRQLGYEPTELIGTSGLELIHPDDKKALLPLMLRYAQTKIKELFKLKMKRVTERINFRIPDKSGKWHFFKSTANLIENIDRKGYNFLLISHDVTEGKHAGEALKESEERYRDLVEKAGNAIVINDLGGNFKYFNNKFPELFGHTREEMMQKSMASLIHPDDTERVLTYHKARLADKARSSNYEFRGIKKDGSTIQLEINVVVIKDGENIVGTRAYLWDVTDRKHTEEELRALSLIDQLTGLYNRRGFFTLVKQQIELVNRTRKGFYMLFCDLDKMKWINDTFGHCEGDEALKNVTKLLTKSFRKSDIIGRMGGDEFAICAIEARPDSAEVLNSRLHKNLDQYNSTQKKGYELSLSIGVTYYDPSQPCTVEKLLELADRLMYKQKIERHGEGVKPPLEIIGDMYKHIGTNQIQRIPTKLPAAAGDQLFKAGIETVRVLLLEGEVPDGFSLKKVINDV